MKKVLYSLYLMIVFSSGCSDDEARPEVINKLRAIGVEYTPFVSSGAPDSSSAVAASKIYFVTDSEETSNIEVTTDERILGRLNLPTTLSNNARVSEYDGSLKVYSYQSSVVLPLADQLQFPDEAPFLTFNTGYELTQGSEIEKIVSRYVLHPAESDQVSWVSTPPTVDITSLTNGETKAKGEIPLKAEITNRNGETYKVSWYVSSGEVVNRRAIDTKWKDMEAGTHTILIAIHGKSTASFSWQAVDITIE